MLQSKLFPGSLKENPKDEVSVSAKYLIRAGFIDKLMAGVYTILPLGWKVLHKIEDIIREEMDAIDGQEVLMPSLSPQENWRKTADRLNKIDVLFEARGANKESRRRNDATYVLSCTHEDIITPLAKKMKFSYKDFPLALYQIQAKFRNEARAKSGILRGREFRMKDLYSFHRSPEGLKKFYEKSKGAYANVFERLGIGADTHITLASGGDFTKDYSHEFQTECEAGEDLVFKVKSSGVCYNREITPSQASEFKVKEGLKEMELVKGEGVISVQELIKFLKIDIERTTKTLVYETDQGDFLLVAIRGDYEINEEKLCKVAGVERIWLAEAKKVKKLTGAEVGYIGVLNVPKKVKLFMDDSLRGRVNFEAGANKTNYHAVNVNFGRDLEEPKEFYDIKTAKEGDIFPETGEKYEVFKGSEVGNIFPLNTKFSEAFDYRYTDKDGSKKIVYMGSYGIGSTRAMGVIVEKLHDDKGIIWPEAVAPFKVHLISIGENEKAQELYEKLQTKGVEVLFDDRDMSPGGKFAEADLIGCPYRVVISAKTLEKGKIEVKKRNDDKIEFLNEEELLSKIK
ncbi:MAG: proline--tRNA ligase [Candidatus Moranbacteria bacterium]|nr:proline--tRNA ligase [Candidatus Moranbacteria bacterium]